MHFTFTFFTFGDWKLKHISMLSEYLMVMFQRWLNVSVGLLQYVYSTQCGVVVLSIKHLGKKTCRPDLRNKELFHFILFLFLLLGSLAVVTWLCLIHDHYSKNGVIAPPLVLIWPEPLLSHSSLNGQPVFPALNTGNGLVGNGLVVKDAGLLPPGTNLWRPLVPRMCTDI